VLQQGALSGVGKVNERIETLKKISMTKLMTNNSHNEGIKTPEKE
jgi:hypothetical protein